MNAKAKAIVSLGLTLRGRLIALISLATIPAVLFTVFIAQNERAVALQRSLDDAHYTINLLSREHLYQLTGAKELLKWLAIKCADKKNETQIRDSNFLAALLSGYPQLGNIAILAPNGDVLSSAYPVSGCVNMFGIDAIQRALHSNEIETGVYVVGPIVKKPLLHLAQSIKDIDGTVRYIIFVAIDLDWMKHLADKIELPSQHIVMIVDRDGRVLTSAVRSADGNYLPGTLIPELSQAARKTTGTVIAGQSKRNNLFITAPIEDLPGVVIATSLPFKSISDKANETFLRMLVCLGLLTLCTAGSVIFLEEIALLRYLRSLSKASKRFGEGDYSARAPIPRGYGELQSLAEVFNTMAETLTRRHSELVDAHDELDRLSRYLQQARESEAQRIARDLHDEVGQVLTSIKLDLSSFLRQCRQQNCSGTLETIIEDNLITATTKIDALVEFVRQIASDLRPPVLDRIGLSAAVELLVRNLEKRTELIIDLDIENLDEPLEELISITIYRIIQEALTNVVRHAHAQQVNIKLRQNDNIIELFIEDDGQGIDNLHNHSESLGIIGMRERARTANGTFLLDSTSEKGTKVTVLIPRLGRRN